MISLSRGTRLRRREDSARHTAKPRAQRSRALVTASLCAASLLCSGCERDQVAELSKWTLFAETCPDGVAVTLPIHLSDRLPRHESVFTLRSELTLTQGSAQGSLKLVVPMLHGEAKLRVNGAEAIPTRINIVDSTFETGPREWHLPPGLESGQRLHLELEIRHAYFRSGWLDTVPYVFAGRTSSPEIRWIRTFNEVTSLIMAGVVLAISLMAFFLWLKDRRLRESGLLVLECMLVVPFGCFDAGLTQAVFGDITVNVVVVAIIGALTAAHFKTHSEFGYGKVSRPLLIAHGAIVLLAVAYYDRFDAPPLVVCAAVIAAGIGVALQLASAVNLVRRRPIPLNGVSNLLSWVAITFAAAFDAPLWFGAREVLGGLHLFPFFATVFCFIAFIAQSRRHVHDRKQADLLNIELNQRLAEKQQIEKALVEAARAWRTTFDAIGAGVCLVDHDGKIMRTNRAMASIVKHSLQNLVGVDLASLLGVRPSAVDPSGGSRNGSLHENRTLQHEGRWYAVTVDRVMNEDNQCVGNVLIMTDITFQRELEQQLFHAQKMDAIGRLAGGVAHDFNNLLSVIISYAEFICEEVCDDEMRGDAEEIVKAGHRAASLTRQLLAFSRKQIVQAEILNPNKVINDLSKMLSRLIGEHIELRLSLGADIGNVSFDPSQLEHVIINLVVNARDAMPGPGTIVIETRKLSLDRMRPDLASDLHPGRYIAISVIDAGLGMTQEIQARIFEPFFTTKQTGKGTGLGLAMVYGAVKQAGGSIGVRSVLGEGTTFTIYLEHEDADSNRTSAPADPKLASSKGETLLVVEDEEPVRVVIAKILRAAGYRIVEASSGKTALERFCESPEEIALVVTDVVMPEMSGVELAAELRQRNPALEILYLSGYSFEVLTEHGVDPATIRILAKPFSRNELLAAVKNALGPSPSWSGTKSPSQSGV